MQQHKSRDLNNDLFIMETDLMVRNLQTLQFATFEGSSLLNGVFPEPLGVGKDDLQFNLRRVIDSLARIVETRSRRVSV